MRCEREFEKRLQIKQKRRILYAVGIIRKLLPINKERGFSMSMPMIDNAKVLPKGQITIPKDIRDHLRINVGDRLTLVCENDRLVLMNSAIFALKEFQGAMEGEAEKAGLNSDKDVVDMFMKMRREES